MRLTWGGNDQDEGRAITVDGSGNAYVTGNTTSTNFPVLNAAQAAYGGNWSDAFITKLSPSGSLAYSTYLGGNDWDVAYAIALDTSANAYVTGNSLSTNFPAANSLPSNLRGTNNVFAAKLNATGSAFSYIAAFGRSEESIGNGIAVDSSGNAYITGHTIAPDFRSLTLFKRLTAGARMMRS